MRPVSTLKNALRTLLQPLRASSWAAKWARRAVNFALQPLLTRDRKADYLHAVALVQRYLAAEHRRLVRKQVSNIDGYLDVRGDRLVDADEEYWEGRNDCLDDVREGLHTIFEVLLRAGKLEMPRVDAPLVRIRATTDPRAVTISRDGDLYSFREAVNLQEAAAMLRGSGVVVDDVTLERWEAATRAFEALQYELACVHHRLAGGYKPLSPTVLRGYAGIASLGSRTLTLPERVQYLHERLGREPCPHELRVFDIAYSAACDLYHRDP